MSCSDYKVVRLGGVWYVFKKGSELKDSLFDSESFTECYSFIKAMADNINVEP